MKIHCACGAVLPDQSDFLSFKAHLVADRDWEDFVAPSETGREIDASFVRHAYQCPECGRLHVEDAARRLHAFSPDEAAVPQLLGSIRGNAWRGSLIGTWTDVAPQGRASGDLWCDAEQGTEEEHESWAELEAAYFALFERLRRLDRLRSAFLRRNGSDVHRWAPGAS